MTLYSGFQVGNFVGPLTANTTNSLTQDADPAIYYTLDYFKTMLQTYLAARFDSQMTAAGLTQHVGKAFTTALPYDPLPFLQSSGVQPPFLALFPEVDKPQELTRSWYEVEEQWQMLWVLPPMDSAQFAQLYSILRAAGKTIQDRLENTRDPAWQNGTPFAELAGLQEIRLNEVRYGSIERLETNLFFPALSASFTAKERRMPTPNLQDFVDMAVTIAVQDEDGEEDVVELEVS